MTENYKKTYTFPYRLGDTIYLIRGDDYVSASITAFIIRSNWIWVEALPNCLGNLKCDQCVQGNKKDPPGLSCEQIQLKRNKRDRNLWEIADLGKTVFLKKEDAEKALR